MLSWHICILWVGMVQLCGSIVRKRRGKGELSVSRTAALRGETCDQNVQICEESIWAMSFVNIFFFTSVIIVPLSILAYFCSLSTGLKGLRADESGKAVTGRQCPHTGVTQKRKVKKSIQRCQNDHFGEGYKRAIDEIQGPIAKNRFSGRCPLFSKT